MFIHGADSLIPVGRADRIPEGDRSEERDGRWIAGRRDETMKDDSKERGRTIMDNNKTKKTIEERKRPEAVTSRRNFLKKAAYAAPTLMVLGQLGRPSEANAGFGPPPSDPNS
jgi:hypothetical protein